MIQKICPTCKAASNFKGVLVHDPDCCDVAKYESISEEARRIITSSKRSDYGPAEESFDRIAEVWTGLLRTKLSQQITGKDVAILMTGFKLCREMNAHKRDNLVDAVGYLELADLIMNSQKNSPKL